ncbi:DUF928 domain-containing protein [Calothrix sp. CCY 0018]|uniref:DUF928 domain-containing protein n=1 Tax=Calothrix sp. CCY 0018 TaxID=3103864 RepID=UPI0039C6B430
MIDISTRFRCLLLASIASVLVFPALSIAPEATSAQTIEITYWQRLKDIFRRKRRKPISRPLRGICLISPQPPELTENIPPTLVYDTKPLFLWKGDIKKIAVESPGSKEYLGTRIVTGNQSVNYTGQPLEPGKTYRWLIFLSELESASPTRFVPFKIMEAPERNRITAELKRLEILQKNKGANAEKIAFTKAEYFIQKGLWSDALQQAYSVPNPSPELSQIIKDLPNQLCESK